MKESKPQEEVFIDYLEGCKKLIAKIARAYCNDPEERRDLLQEITLQLWKAFPRYDSTYAVTTWTYRIAINTSISFLRKASKINTLKASYSYDTEYLHMDNTAEDEKIDMLYAFIDLLKPIDKAIVVMQLDGCSNKDISEVIGLSLTNISSRKLRIKEELKKHFEKSKQAT